MHGLAQKRFHGMGCKCGHGHGMMHGHGFPGPAFPLILLIPLTVALTSICSVLIMARALKELEAMTLTKALDDMGDRLTEDERADLEMRIRDHIFG